MYIMFLLNYSWLISHERENTNVMSDQGLQMFNKQQQYHVSLAIPSLE